MQPQSQEAKVIPSPVPRRITITDLYAHRDEILDKDELKAFHDDMGVSSVGKNSSDDTYTVWYDKGTVYLPQNGAYVVSPGMAVPNGYRPKTEGLLGSERVMLSQYWLQEWEAGFIAGLISMTGYKLNNLGDFYHLCIPFQHGTDGAKRVLGKIIPSEYLRYYQYNLFITDDKLARDILGQIIPYMDEREQEDLRKFVLYSLASAKKG